MSFIAELKRRNVFRVGIAYAVTSWLLIQVTDILLETIGAPPWVMQTMFVALAAGFVIALIFAWAFELTPDGVKKEKDVDRTASIAPKTGQKLNKTIIVLLLIAVAYIAYDKLLVSNRGEVAPTITSQQVEPVVEATPLVASEPETTQKSIVVLPFVNMSNDPDQEFFSDGLSEELLNVLARIKDLRVISRTSAFAFKGKDVDIPTIAAQLDVTHVLEGSVRSAGGDIRITAQLIEVATDSHLWSDAYNRKMENVFEIQEEISKAIARELQVTLGTTGQHGKPTGNLEAYQLFLRGRHLYQSRGEEQLARSVELLKQSVELDPNFAEAWANLAAANIVHGYNQKEGFESLFKDGQRAAMRAIDIDPDNGFAHAALGLIHMGDFAWEDAMREYDLAIRLNPNESNSLLWKGIALLSLGYIDQALVIFYQAEKLDPIFTNLQFWMAQAHMVKGNTEAILRGHRKIQQLDPDFKSFDLSDYELFSGNLDAAEQVARATAIENYDSDVIAAAIFSVLRDPRRKDAAVKTILANPELPDFDESAAAALWRIGATEEAISSLRSLQEQGLGLHAANGLPMIWTAYDRAQLSSPVMPAFFESSGLADYWRKHGNPDHCRVDGETIECGTP